jgi:hypothetical protein
VTTFNAFIAVNVLHEYFLPTGFPEHTETGLCQPSIGPEEYPLFKARQRTNQTFPPNDSHLVNPTWSFSNDFYYRIHIYPNRIEVGNLTERIIYQIEFFNAFLANVSLTNVIPYDNEGVNLSPIPLPSPILSLNSIYAELEISVSGPANINTTYLFEFSLGPTLDLKVTGVRIITFSIAPDWTRQVTEKLSFLTQILEARDGTEQRIILRQIPRWTFRYTFLEGGKTVNLVDSLLVGWGARSFATPIWPQKSKINFSVPAGSMMIYCNTVNRGFVAGGLCVLWRDALYCETLEIAGVSANQLSLVRPVSQFYASAFAIPARLCHFVGDRSKITAITSDVLEGEVEFESDDLVDIIPQDLTDRYQGLGILPYKHDYKAGRDRAFQRSMVIYDNGIGVTSRVDRRGYPLDEFSYKDIMFGTRESINAFKSWLMSVYGPAKPFYVILNEDQLKPTRDLESGVNTLYVDHIAYGILASYLNNRKTLVMRTNTERYIFDVVSYMGTNEGDLLIYTNFAWPRSITVGEIVQIGFLVKARLNQDEFEIDYSADTLARTSLEIKGIIQ